MGISSMQFVLANAPAEGSESHHRNVRKVYLNPEALKASRLCTADVIAIAGDTFTDTMDFALGAVWPSLELSQNSIVIPSSLQLTARLKPGQNVHVFPLSGMATSRLPSGIPGLRHAQEVATLRFREISTEDISTRPTSGNTLPSKRKDWLNLFLREYLGQMLAYAALFF
ncbi:hypothetical protein D9756_004534 [Leucocoprinus leucothites]|uniref:Uncharacterized protein n=1 Tax=Leucocoprinus leucothites TaxID=201217 RepID=A0A8H5G9M9_9AGAR|nr:hypothetical protein D9756_004534 [Leucoagaricus leucothites]